MKLVLEEVKGSMPEFLGPTRLPSVQAEAPRRPRRFFENLPERPKDRFQTAVAEGISPTMGAYGTAALATEALLHASEGNYQKAFEVGSPLLAMFFGPMARNANLTMLNKAKEMVKAGADAEAVWKETGWFQDKEGSWSFESRTDDTARLNRTFESSAFGTLGEGLIFPEIYENYPKLRDTGFKTIRAATPLSGRPFSRGKFSPDFWENRSAIDVTADTPRGLLRSTIHEVQHNIDFIEGRTYGENPANVTPEQIKLAEAFIQEKTGPISERISRLKENMKGILSSYENYKNLEDPFIVPDQKTMSAEDYSRYLGFLTDLSKELDALTTVYDKELGTKDPKFLAYRMNVGETRARNAETRLTLKPATRSALSPWFTEDIPRRWQIPRLRLEPAEPPSEDRG